MKSKKNSIVAIQTARKGSESVPLKNELLIDETPLFLYNLKSAKNCSLIDKVFMSTDIEQAEKYSESENFDIIQRPNNLSGSNDSHFDVIDHALGLIEKKLAHEVDIIVILLGNNRCAYPEDLEKGIKLLLTNNDLDSVISVGKYNMFNPLRAYRKTEKKSLTPILGSNENYVMTDKDTNDKDILGDIYFFNGSFWIIRKN